MCWYQFAVSVVLLFLFCIRVCHLCLNVAFVVDVVLWSCFLVCVIEFVLLSLVLFLDLVVLFLLCCWYVSCVLV